jgi:hypothetical protein
MTLINSVTPAQAGVQDLRLDSRLRGNDDLQFIRRF